ncbi:MAG: TIM barrel protein [Rhodobacteraceae bacterium]|nr:TIM barrel protein [Paracoccaceae bacterium]
MPASPPPPPGRPTRAWRSWSRTSRTPTRSTACGWPRACDRLAHVHLQDADGHADRHWALGDGTIRWAGVFRALADCASAPRLVLELADKRGIGPSMDYLGGLGLGR